MSFGDFATAAAFRDSVVQISEGVVRRMRPETRVAVVKQINKDNLTAEVSFTGDKGSLNARFGLSLIPREVGTLVRVAGKPGDYYITEILNGSGEHADYEPIKEVVLDPVIGNDALNATMVQLNIDLGANNDALNLIGIAANGKNSVHYEDYAPTNEANTAGDIWYVRAATPINAPITAQYEGKGGTAWESRALTNVVVTSLDAGVITSGVILSARLITTTLNADNMTTGTMSAARISATTFNGYTFTGAIFQTASGNTNAVRLDTSGFNVWSGGTNTFSASSSGLTLEGTLSVGSSGKVVGGTVGTAASGSRMEMTNDGVGGRLSGYNSSNVRVGYLDFGTGVTRLTGPGAAQITISSSTISLLDDTIVSGLLTSNGFESDGKLWVTSGGADFTGTVTINDTLSGLGRNMSGWDFGNKTGNTDGSGNISVSHNVGGTADTVVCTGSGNAGRQYTVTSSVNGSFTVKVTNASGANVASAAVEFYWWAMRA